MDIHTEAMGISRKEVALVAKTCEKLGLPIISLPVCALGIADFADPVRRNSHRTHEKIYRCCPRMERKERSARARRIHVAARSHTARRAMAMGARMLPAHRRLRGKKEGRYALELEPFRLSLLNSVDAMAKFVDECGHRRIRANIDISHLVLSDTGPHELRKLKNKAIHVHLSDCDGQVHGDLPPGRGIVKFAPYLQAIKELEMHDAVVSIELEYPPDPKKIVSWVEEAYTGTARLMELAGLRN